MLIIFLPSLHYPFFLHYSSPIFPPHTSTRSNVFVQSNHLLSNSKHISLTILCLQHVTVSLPLFTLRLSHYPLRPAFCLHVSPFSTSKPDFFHNSYALLLSLTASSVSLFHHHVILCLALPLVLPHTASVSSNRQSFNPFHMDSRSPSSLLSSLHLTLSAKSFRISVSLSRHTLCLPTNFFFLFFTLSCKSILQTNSLCCFTHSSLPMTFMSVTFARSHLLTTMLIHKIFSAVNL